MRAFGSVGGSPLFIKSANADHIYDVDGNEFIDYVCSWGPGILGHAHPQVIEAVKKACVDGLTFGAPTKKELELAELITDAMPSIEKVRLVNSGTEATMSAIRTARGYTGRDMIIKFRGNYHGHSDGHFLLKAWFRQLLRLLFLIVREFRLLIRRILLLQSTIMRTP